MINTEQQEPTAARAATHLKTKAPQVTPETEMWGYKEVARYLKKSEGTIRAWVCEKRIPHIRLGRRDVRFVPDEIAAWLRAKHVAV